MNSGDLTKCSTVTNINIEMSSPEMSSPGTSSPGITSPGMFSPGLSSRGTSSPGGESVSKDKNAKDKKSDESKPVQIKSTQFFPDETNARSSLGLPRIPSSESELWSGTPPLPGHQSESPKLETKIPEKTSPIGEASKKLSRKESYKAQRRNYRQEKKRVANEVQTTLKDSSIALLEDWLKIRGTLKSWTKLWCIVKPGLLLLYKSSKAKSNHWVGTILLNSCQVIERPSKKDGFCFKIFHALDQSIWAPRGPENETIGAVVQPLPTSYLIFRAPSQAAGRCWMESLEIAIRSTTILRRSTSTKSTCGSTNHETQWSEADYEKHFEGQELDVMQTSYMTEEISDSESEVSVKDEIVDEKVFETPYIPCVEEEDSLGKFGEQTEELPEEQKSLLWFLMKQVRPGMDLSRVVLPTFILEPRSFLDKLSDCYYHADILSRAVQEDDPFTRMKTIIQWYLSGLYKKPKGLKKPYNPILGETFRCFWAHPNGSKTFYIAEQVSHHPPVSAFYATNRQDGYSVSCSILARSKYWGNSTSAMLDGVAVLTLLPRGEDYTITVPYAHCRGILIGTLTMELGGKISIECEKTGYKTELDFKLKPFLGGSSDVNSISGKLKLNEQTLALISGYWDGAVTITDRRTKEVQILWNPTPEIREKRLTRYVVPVEHQDEFESERLWKKVSEAIHADDLVAATEEKTVLEESQRTAAKERRIKNKKWVPKYFDQDPVTGSWVYRSADLRPWDPRNDLFQFEHEFIIQTKTKHITPIVRASSIVSVEPAKVRSQSPVVIIKARQKLNKKSKSLSSEASAEEFRSDSSASEHTKIQRTSANTKILEGIARVQSAIQDQKSAFNDLKVRVECLSLAQEDFFANQTSKINYKDAIFTMLGVLLAAIVLKIIFF